MRTTPMSFLAAAVLAPALASTALASANLSITNTTQPTPATVRKALTYDINVVNNGPDVANNVTVTDTLPTGTILVSARFVRIQNNQQTTPTPCGGTTTITCKIGTMGIGNLQGAGVFITVRPQNFGVVLEDTATVTADQEASSSATAETEVVPAESDPELTDSTLLVSSVITTDLNSPTTIAFLGDNDFLVLEKDSGKIKRVINGVVQPNPVLDLGVNNFQERGLLGIALHPQFEDNHFVYLYWTCRAVNFMSPCLGLTSPADSSVPGEVPLRGNRVDRFVWNGTTGVLTWEKELIQLHAFQDDASNGVQRGNHNGGKIAFGPDGKLYIYMGDNGRRGWLQNVLTGFGPNGNDDQFGGPEPDNAHMTGFILRLNDDGSTPEDNPFFNVQRSDLAAELQPRASDEVLANLRKLFAYGIRNGFGMAFDPETGQLWEAQNGDDSGSEINRIEAGFNGGWVQIMGRLDNIASYKEIETSPVYFGLQQVRWSPTLIADSADEALARLFNLPGSRYTDPILTWRFEIAPAGLGFMGPALGPESDGNLVIGGARDFLLDGQLFRFKLTADRMDIDLSDNPDLDATRVIDDIDKWSLTGSENFLFGIGFGLVTDIRTGPSGELFVVSLSKGAVYKISQR